MAIRKTFHFSTVVWGPWHTGVFLDVNLSSLLAPGNLAAFAQKHDVLYRIFTSRDDVERIEATKVFQLASKIVRFELIGLKIDRSIDPIAMHHMLWRRGIDEARKAGAMILLIPPDVVWSNGAFGHIADIAAQGKKAIFMMYTRVVSETAVPEVKRLFQDPETSVVDAPSRPLVELCMRHLHPLALTYVRDCPNFPVHPELILWPVGGEGYLMRSLVREMFAYDPRHFDLNTQALLAHRPSLADVHYITDSDDLFSLSLTPLMKDIEWFAKPAPLDPLQLGAWWLRYDSPVNDIVADHHFHVHTKGHAGPLWRRAELQSDILIRRLMGTREVLRILSGLAQQGRADIEQILATALIEAKLARWCRKDGPITILLPNRSTTRRWVAEEGPLLAKRGARRRLLRFILDHVLVGHLSLDPGIEVTLPTPVGGWRKLTWDGQTPRIDGVPITTPGLVIGGVWCFPLEMELLPSNTNSRYDACEKMSYHELAGAIPPDPTSNRCVD
jgi:hypothetical protein